MTRWDYRRVAVTNTTELDSELRRGRQRWLGGLVTVEAVTGELLVIFKRPQ